MPDPQARADVRLSMARGDGYWPAPCIVAVILSSTRDSYRRLGIVMRLHKVRQKWGGLRTVAASVRAVALNDAIA